jgi:hypothetical protein
MRWPKWFRRYPDNDTSSSNDEVARELATAIIKAVMGAVLPANTAPGWETHFDTTVERLKPNSAAIARALCIVASEHRGVTVAREVLTAYLQAELTKEHVEAQRSMGIAVETLTKRLYYLAIATLIATLIATCAAVRSVPHEDQKPEPAVWV